MRDSSTFKKPSIQVLLSTFNGEQFLEEQLLSLINQKDVDIHILVRDDGSSDNTIHILELWKNKGLLQYYTGENKGPAFSFIDLLEHSGDFDYFAFCDQDDYWKEDKLICAINKLNTVSSPYKLYISALQIVDEKLNNIDYKRIKIYPTIKSTLIKSDATGCTEVFNKRLRDILTIYHPKFIMMHDSWVERVCLSVGGELYVDDNSHILYRQHGTNVIGYKDSGIKKLYKQLQIAFHDHIRIRVNIARELLNGFENYMPRANAEWLKMFCNYPSSSAIKLKLLLDREFKSPIKLINFETHIAIILNKF